MAVLKITAGCMAVLQNESDKSQIPAFLWCLFHKEAGIFLVIFLEFDSHHFEQIRFWLYDFMNLYLPIKAVKTAFLIL